MPETFSYEDAVGAAPQLTPAAAPATAPAYTPYPTQAGASDPVGDKYVPNQAQSAAAFRLSQGGQIDDSADPGTAKYPLMVVPGRPVTVGQHIIDLDGNYRVAGDADAAPTAPAPVASPVAQPDGNGPQTFSYNDAVGGQPPTGSQKVDEGLGFMRELERPLDNLSTWVENGIRAVPGGAGFDDWLQGSAKSLGMSTDAETTASHDKMVADAAARGVVPGKLGGFAGSVLGTAPVAMLPAGPLLQGAAGGALTTTKPNDPGAVAIDAGLGGAGGVVAHGLLSATGKVIAPRFSSAVQTLMSHNVPLTPGQMAGGAFQRMEDASTSIPILGDAIKSAQRRSVEGLNRAAFNSALTPIGETMPANINVGRDGVNYVADRLGSAYEALAPKLSVKADGPYAAAIGGIRSQMAMLPKEYGGEFDRILKTEVASRFDPATGAMSGQAAKDADTALGQYIRQYSANPQPYAQAMVRGLQDTKTSLIAAVARNNPAAADQLAAINQGWAAFTRPRAAAASVGANGGLFTAPQLSAAVRAGDRSVAHSAYAKGDALMQNLSDAGREVLPSTVPDSGTALRFALSELPVMVGVGSESHLFDLGAAGHIALGGGLAGSLYSRPGQKLLNAAMGSRPTWAPTVRNLMDTYLRPPVTAAAGLGAASMTRTPGALFGPPANAPLLSAPQ